MADKKEKKKKSFKEWFNGIKIEMKKVVWPTRKNVISYSAVVVVVCALFAAIFWAIDTGVLAALKAVLGITLS